ncbi:MAG: spore germination protein [Clostridia bacterium]|nr:spore germination protein [Clostridia bacterium]
MNLKNIFQKLFTYEPPVEYNFSLPEGTQNTESNDNQAVDSVSDTEETINIFPSLNVNLEYMKTKYNLLINSDVILRQFTINARGKQYNAFLVYIDGMVDSEIMDKFVLEPLMLRNKSNLYEGTQSKVISEAVANNITVRKVKKFDLSNYLMGCLMPQNAVKEATDFDTVANGINSGNCALFVDTLSLAFDIEVKGFKQRSVNSPNNEIVIKGPHEAFVENIRTNTSLIRRIVNNENLVIENLEVGKITKTKCAICYMKNITNSDLVNEVKYRLNNLEIDSLLSAGELEQLLVESNALGIPEMISTERPDKTAKYLLKGRVIVIVNGTPYGIIMPAILIDFLTSPEDSNLKVNFANFLRMLRFLAAFITLLLPGLYVAITSFHQEILPTGLLYSILSSRENVPFPIIVEILLMEISFELIREAGLRVPSAIGPTIGIVGALVLGQAAVSAGIVSPILIIIVAMTGIASFAIPDFSFGFHLRYFRFAFVLLGFMAGFLGIALGLFVYISFVCSLRSFGVSYTTPFAPTTESKGNGYLLNPIWKREYRPSYIASKKEKNQAKISMKWKYHKKP